MAPVSPLSLLLVLPLAMLQGCDDHAGGSVADPAAILSNSAPSATVRPVVDPYATIACFAEGTLIDTPTGPVPIEQLGVGDWVLSYDHDAQRVEPDQIVGKIVNPSPSIVDVAISQGSALRVTAEHPLYDQATNEYVEVGNLGPSQVLLGLRVQGGEFETFDVSVSSLSPIDEATRLGGEATKAFDLTMRRHHNFFAGGVLAHNKTPWPPPSYDPSPFQTEMPSPVPTCLAPLLTQPCWESLPQSAEIPAAVGLAQMELSSIALRDGLALGTEDARFVGCPLQAVDAGVRDAGDVQSATPDGVDASRDAAAWSARDGGGGEGAGGFDASTATDAAVLDAGLSLGTGGANWDGGPGRADALPDASVDAGAEGPKAPWDGLLEPAGDASVPLPAESACAHVIQQRFFLCSYPRPLPYAMRITLLGEPGRYRVRTASEQAECSGGPPLEEQELVIEAGGSASTWFAAPSFQPPWMLSVRGDTPFRVTVELL